MNHSPDKNFQPMPRGRGRGGQKDVSRFDPPEEATKDEFTADEVKEMNEKLRRMGFSG